MVDISLRRIDQYRLEIRRRGRMLTHGVVYANHALERCFEGEEVLQQVANVACLPGIIGPSLAMPDIHWGYGFPIGGVAAFSVEDGVVSPGGVGYDINCGIRCIATGLSREEVSPVTDDLLVGLYRNIPAGVGSSSRDFRPGRKDFRKVITEGARWVMKQGMASAEDIDFHEDRGCIEGADPDAVSEKAYERGMPQLGTLGSGNHFVEVDAVDEVFDPDTAAAFGLFEGQVVVLVHTGSRGFGHQICDDYVHSMLSANRKFGIELPDRQLACAPVTSSEGGSYLAAMAAAANFAYANRQIITSLIRRTFEEQFGRGWEKLGMRLIYDCCHNIAKKEEVTWEGRRLSACVHRKGATRALPPGDPRLPGRYLKTGQPILVPGDMGTMSYILAAREGSEETFRSACHGAGRLLSRHVAKKLCRGRSVIDELKGRGISVMAASRSNLAEEIPEAYKDVSEVVSTITGAGIAGKVARLKPLAMVKG